MATRILGPYSVLVCSAVRHRGRRLACAANSSTYLCCMHIFFYSFQELNLSMSFTIWLIYLSVMRGLTTYLVPYTDLQKTRGQQLMTAFFFVHFPLKHKVSANLYVKYLQVTSMKSIFCLNTLRLFWMFINYIELKLLAWVSFCPHIQTRSFQVSSIVLVFLSISLYIDLFILLLTFTSMSH